MGSLRKQLFFVVLIAGCSTDFTPKPCAVDGDCNAGSVCELRETKPVCVLATDAPLVIGESAPISGNNYALGTEMKRGVLMAIAEQNALGGIRGRQLVLNFRDDGYDPPIAEQAARTFVDAQVSMTDPPKCPSSTTPQPDGHGNTTAVSTNAIERGPNAVLAELGTVGTPTMVRAAPVVVESQTLYFGAFTGAKAILRDATAGVCSRFVFNVRASYGQEAQATTDLFKFRQVPDYKNMISFDQNDTFGDAGYNGLKAAYPNTYPAGFPGTADPTTPIARFRYTRNDETSVPAQAVAAEAYITGLLTAQTGPNVVVGVMMTDTYGAGSAFITLLRTWQFDGMQTALGKDTRLKLFFSNVSFVGPNALSDNLKTAGTVNCPTSVCGSSGTMPLTQDVVVSQVVPNYQGDTSDIVAQYNKAITANGFTPSFTSLEGYLDVRIFIAGLLAHKGPFTPESLIDSFEHLPDLSLGIGANAGFKPCADPTMGCGPSHQYSNSVWGTSILANGSFKNLYFWTAGQTIQFF
jgi:branched-chain amino acid transport system substrate-binding protein